MFVRILDSMVHCAVEWVGEQERSIRCAGRIRMVFYIFSAMIANPSLSELKGEPATSEYNC